MAEELARLYPPSSTPSVTFKLEHKDLHGLDFSHYKIDPRSSFAHSNLEGCHFDEAWFEFDFEQQVDFRYAYLRGARFPEPGTPHRVPGVQFKLEGAITDGSTL